MEKRPSSCVLGTAALKLGSRDEAFRLVGKEAMVQNRNHHKALKRELERVEALYRTLDDEKNNPFGALSDGDER